MKPHMIYRCSASAAELGYRPQTPARSYETGMRLSIGVYMNKNMRIIDTGYMHALFYDDILFIDYFINAS